MTLQEAIAKIDDLKPNQYKHPHKIGWISDLDGRIYNEVIKHFKNIDEIEWTPYDENTNPSLVLLVPDPYAEIYIYYLAAKIDWFNGEYTRYNNDMSMFNDAYQAYADEYRKTHESAGINKLRL